MQSRIIRTIQALLRAPEDVLRILWEYTQTYTLLVNELFIEVPKHPKFEQWKQHGSIPREAVEKEILASLKQDERFAGLPSRLYVSATFTTVQVYKAWLKQQSKWYWQLSGYQRWFDVISSGSQLTTTTKLSFKQIQERAHEVLQQTQQTIFDSQLPKDTQPQDEILVMKKRSLMGKLLKAYDDTTDELTQLAIVHLLLNGFQVADEAQTAEAVAKRLDVKRIEITRLKKRLNSRFPKGRDPLGDRFFQDIDIATSVPVPQADGPEAFAAEFDQWLDQKQIRLFNSAPYPLLFESPTDLIWFKVTQEKPAPEERIQSPLMVGSKTLGKKKRRSKKRRRKIPETRICVCFHTMRSLKFEIYCDRRQLYYFKQFLSDYEAYPKSEGEKFSAGSFLFRSATVFWVEDEKLRREMKRQQRKQAGETDALPELPPWKTHQLYLHIAIDNQQLTTEGTEQVRQESLKEYKKRLQRSEDKLNKLEDQYQAVQQQRPLTTAEAKKIKDQRSSVKRTRTTIERLTNTTLKRPSNPPYQGQKNRVMAVSFDRQDPVTIVVVDQLHPSTQFHCSTEELLIYHRARIKAVNRNVRLFKLKRKRRVPTVLAYKLICYLGDREATNVLVWLHYQLEKTGHTILGSELQYQLVRVSPTIANLPILLLLNLDTTDIMSDHQTVIRLHQQHEERVRKRAHDQKLKRRYRNNSTESNTQEYIARVIAAAVVELAIELQVSVIIAPDLSNIRERVEAQIRAAAQREYPNNYTAQNNYAKKTRDSFHRWNYSQLTTFIQERARKDGVVIAIMLQPIEGTLIEKATKMATDFRPEHLLQAPK